jgi:hypothetical protein
MAKPNDATSAPLPAPQYPNLEEFAERAHFDDVESTFATLKVGLSELKGPAAQKIAKVETAIASAQELLRHLLEARERLAQEGKARR